MSHASPPPPPPANDLRTLDTLRRNLTTLSHTLTSLHTTLLYSPSPSPSLSSTSSAVLPPYPSLLTSFTLLSHNLAQLHALLQNQQQQVFLRAAVVYPVPSFPVGREGVLGQLVGVGRRGGGDEWVGVGRAWGVRGHGDGDGGSSLERGGDGKGEVGDRERGREQGEEEGNSTAEGVDWQALKGLWDWALLASNDIARGIDWAGEFTNEEREAGVEGVARGLGLRRNLAEGVVGGGGRGGLEEEEDGGSDEDGEEEEERGEGEGMEGLEMGGAGVRKRPTGGRGGGVIKARNRSGEGRTGEGEREMLPLEDVFRFMATGVEPRRVGAVVGGT